MSADISGRAKLVIVWLLLGMLVFLGVQWWQREQQQTRIHTADGAIEIRRSSDGHYHWPGTINGHPVDFLVDTGATGTAISTSLARELGLESLGAVQSSTAGGIVDGHEVRADVTLQGGVRVERLRITALPALDGRPLLGMNVLSRLSWQQRDGVLIVDLRHQP
ncbi:TIGR02281 family clan AA aspartic protease [Piscinibacter sp.]|jgi:aspartyl protease family protein|uniref:retropepsin-like aspartic protease family protein n=1 Tax=Piscinibacter sp. TaxID=1903157 RepID=UPI0035594083